MFAISRIGKRLLQKLQKKPFRVAYVAEHVRRGIAYQIRALRDQRGWNQGKLSALLGKPQSVVSRLEDPSYGKVTIQTLLELASVFDVALQVKFVSYSSFLPQTRDVTTHSMQLPSFLDDVRASSTAILRGAFIRFSTDDTESNVISVRGFDNKSVSIPNIASPGVPINVH